MNIITNTLLIFVFIYISLIIGVPGLEHANLIKDKLFLFTGIFIFQLLLKSIYKLRNRCKNIDIKNIIQESFLVAMLSVIGFSIYIDLLNMENTRSYIVSFLNNRNSHSFIISLVISSFILVSLIFDIIITGKKDECEIS